MTRAQWKPENIAAIVHATTKDAHSVPMVGRNSIILSTYIGNVYKIHNGKTYSKIRVSSQMVGHKFGEFCITRKIKR